MSKVPQPQVKTQLLSFLDKVTENTRSLRRDVARIPNDDPNINEKVARKVAEWNETLAKIVRGEI